MSRPLLCLLAPLALVAGGCGSEPPAAANPSSARATDAPSNFQLGACGKVTGFVTWAGPLPPIPTVTDIRPRADGTGHDTRTIAAANAPHLDPFTRAFEGVVVYLRGVEPARARPWDLLPVSVEIRDPHIAVIQGDRTGRVGFVRRGDAVTMQSRDPAFQSLRGRGAAFFALPFPDPGRPLERTFDTCGRIELTSAAGSYWQAADLFVCDHPYYTTSAADGRFTFERVPEGKYDLVAWHPHWATAGFERNPETGQMARIDYPPPLESARPVVVTPGRVAVANLTLPH